MKKNKITSEEFELLNENQLIQEFQIEELEKRYEFAWIDSYKLGASYNGFGVSVVVDA